MILIVDDHADTRDVLVRLFKTEGLEALAAGCAADAFDLMKNRKPALVILDCHMPDFDGFMCLERLRKDPALTDVPVIMFSGGIDGERERALKLGAQEYIRKGSIDWPKLLVLTRKLRQYKDG